MLFSLVWEETGFSSSAVSKPTVILVCLILSFVPRPGVETRALAQCSPRPSRLLTKKLELFVFTVAMATHQAIHFFRQFKIFENGLFELFPSSSEEPGTNESGSLIRSKHSDEIFANKPFRRSTNAQCESLSINEITRELASMTSLGSTSVPGLLLGLK
jgi:hypothetical protein